MKMLDKFACPFPVGAQYIQYPSVESNNINTAFPTAERPNSLWPGTTWEKLWATAGVFFRTEGGQSGNLRTNGRQEDAIRNIVGVMRGSGDNDGGYAVGCFSNLGGEADSNAYDGTRYPRRVVLDANQQNSEIVINPMAGHANGSDIRPTNRLFIIWKRTT